MIRKKIKFSPKLQSSNLDDIKKFVNKDALNTPVISDYATLPAPYQRRNLKPSYQGYSFNANQQEGKAIDSMYPEGVAKSMGTDMSYPYRTLQNPSYGDIRIETPQYHNPNVIREMRMEKRYGPSNIQPQMMQNGGIKYRDLKEFEIANEAYEDSSYLHGVGEKDKQNYLNTLEKLNIDPSDMDRYIPPKPGSTIEPIERNNAHSPGSGGRRQPDGSYDEYDSYRSPDNKEIEIHSDSPYYHSLRRGYKSWKKPTHKPVYEPQTMAVPISGYDPKPINHEVDQQIERMKQYKLPVNPEQTTGELYGFMQNGGLPRYQGGGKKQNSDYDIDRALELGYTNDATGHMPSRDYETGRILKAKGHPTFDLAIEEDRKMGYYPTTFNNQTYTIPSIGSPRKGPFSEEENARKPHGRVQELSTFQNGGLPKYQNGGKKTLNSPNFSETDFFTDEEKKDMLLSGQRPSFNPGPIDFNAKPSGSFTKEDWDKMHKDKRSRVERILGTETYNKLKDRPEFKGENVAEFFDSFGSSSWNDALQSHDQWHKSGRTYPTLNEGVEMFGAIPGLGKLGRFSYLDPNSMKRSFKTIPWQKIINKADAVEDEITKDLPSIELIQPTKPGTFSGVPLYQNGGLPKYQGAGVFDPTPKGNTTSVNNLGFLPSEYLSNVINKDLLTAGEEKKSTRPDPYTPVITEGTNIKVLQRYLNEVYPELGKLGEGLVEDGKWNQQTEEVYKKFKADNPKSDGEMRRSIRRALPVTGFLESMFPGAMTPVSALVDDVARKQFGNYGPNDKNPIRTEGDFTDKQMGVTQKIVRNNLTNGLNTVEYEDWNTVSPWEAYGKGSGLRTAAALFTDPAFQAQSTLGRANIVTTPETFTMNPDTLLLDTYDFNEGSYSQLNADKNISTLDKFKDAKSNADSPYGIARNLAQHFGSQEGDKSSKKYFVTTNQNQKRDGGVLNYQNGGKEDPQDIKVDQYGNSFNVRDIATNFHSNSNASSYNLPQSSYDNTGFFSSEEKHAMFADNPGRIFVDDPDKRKGTQAYEDLSNLSNPDYAKGDKQGLPLHVRLEKGPMAPYKYQNGGEVVTDYDKSWDYKKENGVVYTKRKAADKWISPKVGSAAELAIQSKVFGYSSELEGAMQMPIPESPNLNVTPPQNIGDTVQSVAPQPMNMAPTAPSKKVLPEISMPDISIPNIDMPDIDMPDLSLSEKLLQAKGMLNSLWEGAKNVGGDIMDDVTSAGSTMSTAIQDKVEDIKEEVSDAVKFSKEAEKTVAAKSQQISNYLSDIFTSDPKVDGPSKPLPVEKTRKEAFEEMLIRAANNLQSGHILAGDQMYRVEDGELTKRMETIVGKTTSARKGALDDLSYATTLEEFWYNANGSLREFETPEGLKTGPEIKKEGLAEKYSGATPAGIYEFTNQPVKAYEKLGYSSYLKGVGETPDPVKKTYFTNEKGEKEYLQSLGAYHPYPGPKAKAVRAEALERLDISNELSAGCIQNSECDNMDMGILLQSNPSMADSLIILNANMGELSAAAIKNFAKSFDKAKTTKEQGQILQRMQALATIN